MTIAPNPLPQPDFLSIAVRSYADHGKKRPGFQAIEIPSKYTLVFDCETTTDATQALRFGSFQLRENSARIEQGLFYDPLGLEPDELQLLQSYVRQNDLTLFTVNQFIDDYFYGFGHSLGATIVGFNLPFDISRLAKQWGIARRAMKGGFTLRLSTDKRLPNVTVKHISSRMALIRFVTPFQQRKGRGMRRRGIQAPYEAGMFVDVRTLAAALHSRSFSLAALSKHLKVRHPKLDSDEHGGPLSDLYVDYAMRDVQTTWECFEALEAEYTKLELGTPIHKIMSEASIGKAYLAAMGVKPWREVQADFPSDMLGKIMCTYYGGRSEVHIRRKISRIVYCDFLSMYPTVCTKMALWKYVIAQGMTWCNATGEIRNFLKNVTAEDFVNPETWKKLTAIVRLKPDADLLPVRAEYVRNAGTSIGLNYLTSEKSLYYTLADCVAAKLITGKTPRIEEAIVFETGPIQHGLRSVNVAGKNECRVDPVEDDFYKQLIELRQDIKGQLKKVAKSNREQLDTAQQSLKIAANATSYGIFVEVNVRDEKAKKQITCYGPRKPFNVKTAKIEQPGRYFHPLLATLITGAARLLLALVECRVKEFGLDWAFCDTDSMAIARPDNMVEAEFLQKVLEICNWFDGLNPYKHGGPLLKIEDDNYSLSDSGKIEELYCLAVSAKRYALFNLEDNLPIIRKVSSHGLGHLLEPYTNANPAPNMPKPVVDLKDARLWHHDFWHQIIIAELGGNGAEVDLSFHPALKRPAMSQYRASSPDLLAWFKSVNEGKDYRCSIKPFNFLLAQIATHCHGKHAVKSVAPYDKDHSKALNKAFDRTNGKPISSKQLQSYSLSLAQYHLHPEAKFYNGKYLDSGLTFRRHVIATGIRYIGKESDRWEEAMHSCAVSETEIEYGLPMETSKSDLEEFKKSAAAESKAAIAKRAGISERHLANILKGNAKPSAKVFAMLCNTLEFVKADVLESDQLVFVELTELKELVEKNGLRTTAKFLGIDPSNLRRKINSMI